MPHSGGCISKWLVIHSPGGSSIVRSDVRVTCNAHGFACVVDVVDFALIRQGAVQSFTRLCVLLAMHTGLRVLLRVDFETHH